MKNKQVKQMIFSLTGKNFGCDSGVDVNERFLIDSYEVWCPSDDYCEVSIFKLEQGLISLTANQLKGE